MNIIIFLKSIFAKRTSDVCELRCGKPWYIDI